MNDGMTEKLERLRRGGPDACAELAYTLGHVLATIEAAIDCASLAERDGCPICMGRLKAVVGR